MYMTEKRSEGQNIDTDERADAFPWERTCCLCQTPNFLLTEWIISQILPHVRLNFIYSTILFSSHFIARRKLAELPDLEDGEDDSEFLNPVLFDNSTSGPLGVVDAHTGGPLIHENTGEFTTIDDYCMGTKRAWPCTAYADLTPLQVHERNEVRRHDYSLCEPDVFKWLS